MLYYFTGFAGYLVAGYYLKTYGPLRPSVATLLLLGGYAVTAIVFCSRSTRRNGSTNWNSAGDSAHST